MMKYGIMTGYQLAAYVRRRKEGCATIANSKYPNEDKRSSRNK
jgi:hypothetical protein